MKYVRKIPCGTCGSPIILDMDTETVSCVKCGPYGIPRWLIMDPKKMMMWIRDNFSEYIEPKTEP